MREDISASDLAEDWFVSCRVNFVASLVPPSYPHSREKWFLAVFSWHFQEIVEYLNQPNDLDDEKRKSFLLIDLIEGNDPMQRERQRRYY